MMEAQFEVEVAPVNELEALRDSVRQALLHVQGNNETIQAPESRNLNTRRLKVLFLTNILRRIPEVESILPNLRFNQLKALKDFIDFLKTTPDDEALSGYFKQATGAGKTFLFGLFILLTDVETLVLVPTTNLLNQTKGEFKDLGMGDGLVGMVGGGSEETGKKVTLMTYQSFINRSAALRGRYKLIVCDEAHTALGEVTQEALFDPGEEEAERLFFEQHEENIKNAAYLAFTATPQLAEKRVGKYFGKLISSVQMAELVAAGVLKRFKVLSTESTLSEEEDKAPLTVERESTVIEREQVYEKLLNKYQSFRETNPSIKLKTAVFCRNVEECKKFLELAEAKDYKGIIVTGSEGKDRLAEAEQLLRAGEMDFIVTVDKLKAGWNFPPLNAVIWARATVSPASLIQGVGRAGRAYKDEPFAYVFETLWLTRSRLQSDELDEDAEDEADEKPKKEKLLDEPTKEKMRPSRHALNFAQAMASIGEDPKGSMDAYEGELTFIRPITVDENGCAMIEHNGETIRVVASSEVGARHFGMAHSFKFNRKLARAGIFPMPNLVAFIGANNVRVYRYEEVQRAFQYITLDGNGCAEVEMEVEEDGAMVKKRVKVIARSAAAAAYLGIGQPDLHRRLGRSGLEPIHGLTAKAGSRDLAIYYHDEVYALCNPSRLDEEGCITIETPEGTVKAVGICYSSAQGLGTHLLALTDRIKAAGLKPIEGAQASTGRKMVPLYKYDEVKKLFNCVDLDDQGIGIARVDGEEIKVIGGTEAAAAVFSLSKQYFLDLLSKIGLEPIKGAYARSGNATVPVFDYEKAVNAFVTDSLDENGCGILADEGGTILEVSAVCAGSAQHFGFSTLADFEAAIDLSGIKPLPGMVVRMGARFVPLYSSSDLKVASEHFREGEVRHRRRIRAVKQGRAPREDLLIQLDESGCAIHEGRQVAGRGEVLANHLGISFSLLRENIERAGLQPVPGLVAKMYSVDVPVYDYLDLKQKCVPLKVDENGLAIIDLPERGSVMVVASCVAASRHFGFKKHDPFLEKIAASGVQPLENIKALRGSTYAPVYLYDELEAAFKVV